MLRGEAADCADAAMRGVAAMVPSEAEAAMARAKLREAEEGLRRQQAEAMSPRLPHSPHLSAMSPHISPISQQAEAMSPIERRGRPRAIAWYAAQLEDEP